ncbi:4'-phosphopantetheinyl transferase [Pisolithus sp. B1]|nr:4'-phosphopantetheinyl transferase [Pisolithus sp. B1]
MPTHGIGIDILHVSRLAALIKRRGLSKLASRILSSVELDAFRSLTSRRSENNKALATNEREPTEPIVRFLGVRWAVKEAAYKALYPLRPTWKELTYTSFDTKNGLKPALVYTSLSPDATPARLHVSASHDGEYIVASVLAESG